MGKRQSPKDCQDAKDKKGMKATTWKASQAIWQRAIGTGQNIFTPGSEWRDGEMWWEFTWGESRDQ